MSKQTFYKTNEGEDVGDRTAAERTGAELSEEDGRIAALCQTPQARNNQKAKTSAQVSTAQGR